MARRYIQVWMPIKAMEGFKQKKMNLQNAVFEATGKKKNIPMTRILTAVAQKPLYLDEAELRRLASRRSFKQC
jgi:hypothetical protein